MRLYKIVIPLHQLKQIKQLSIMKTFEIECLGFHGFYESQFYNSDSEYYAVRYDFDYLQDKYGKDVTYDDFDLDFKSYTKDMCEEFVKAYLNNTPYFIENLEFTEMVSPKYYNFTTDRVFAKATLADDWQEQLIQIMLDNEEYFTNEIKEHHTSRDGFCSFMENTFSYWIAELKKDEPNFLYVSYAIYYAMKLDDENLYVTLVDEAMEGDVYIEAYLYCTSKKCVKVDWDTDGEVI